ncbi:MAG: hypothetical protein V4515_03030 [Chloroflexota bacterium]
MTATLQPTGSGSAQPTLSAPSLGARLVGRGSVFGKAFRDSLRTGLILGAVFGLLIALTAAQVAAEFTTQESRLAFARQLAALPKVLQGMLGEPIRIDTLGGFVSWRLFNFFPVMFGIWSVVALSGTLAGELARGSLDLVAATPVARRRLALGKIGAYLAAISVPVLILGIVTYASVNGLASLPGDSVSLEAMAGQSVWLFIVLLAPGAAAFAVAPILGRGGALAVGATALFASFLVSAYSDTVPAFASLRGLSFLAITAGHRPLAGEWDWAAVGLLAMITAALLLMGILAFERRDLIVPSGSRFRVPALRLWITGPFLRGIGERLPAALAWGFGLGLYGLIIATSADEFVAQIGKIPQIADMVRRIFPDADIFSTGGFLQLAFFQEGIVMVGLAASVFVAGWASDEGDRRLEVILAAPLGRIGWAVRSGLAVFGAIGITTVIMAAGVAAGAAIQGSDPVEPAIGILVLGLYGMALGGVGLAVGGLIRPSLAAPVTLVLGLGWYLLDILGAILKLPDFVVDLALNRHLGQPIIGVFDVAGLLASAVLAFGGLAIAAIGIQRRDLGR